MNDPAGVGPGWPPPQRAAAVARLARLVRKELSEILRDRRTILTLFLMPVLLYPLLSIAFQQHFLASQLSQKDEPPFRIGFASQGDGMLVAPQLERGWDVLQHEARHPATNAKGSAALRPELVLARNLKDDVFSGLLDLGVRVPDGKASDATPPGPRDCQLLYRKGSARGQQAEAFAQRLLAAAQRDSLRAAGSLVLRPDPVAIEDPTTSRPFSLAPIIPLVLILMTITGAVYPAIDLTAGERERGTLEILMAAPVPRLGLLFAKYVSVVTVAVLTALVNLVAMFATIALSGLGPLLFPQGGPSLLLVLELFGLLLLFAAFFSAVLLTLTSFARSFKEAQAYLIPLMLASLGPGLLAIMPGMQLRGVWTVVPLVNIVLLARDLLEARAALASAGIVVGSTLLYALAAVAVAARIFGSEGVLYNEQSTWSDLWRRPATPRPTPTVAGALFCLVLMFPTLFVLQRLLAWIVGADPNPDGVRLAVAAQALFGVLLFGGFPAVSALLRRVRVGSGFLLRPAPWPAYLGGLLLGLSLWPFVLALLAWMQQHGVMTFDPEKFGFADLRLTVPGWLLIGSVVVAALFEELFFRGYLFSALRAGSGPYVAVVASAVLFGLFHLVAEPFAPERLLPSILLGLVLGWVCLRSGSVVPSMLLHGCHNTMLGLAYLRILPLQADADLLAEQWPWLAVAAVGAVVGAALMLGAGRTSGGEESQRVR